MKNFYRGGRGLDIIQDQLASQSDEETRTVANKKHDQRDSEQQNEANNTLKARKIRIKKYACFLSAIAKEFNEMDFSNYRPSEIIDNFWSKYNWDNSEQVNLFDLILLARVNARKGTKQSKAIDNFLGDFVSFMIASHTVHYMNHDYSSVGRFLSSDEVKDIKAGVRIDFLSRLVGVQ